MSIKHGEALKNRGMQAAAEQKPTSLRMARQYLKELALKQGNVTADDAADYVERTGLTPLGNAAGSLFKESHWEFTGEWIPSRRTSNHAHRNRVYRLRVSSVAPVPAVKPLSPTEGMRELKNLELLYEKTRMTSETYDSSQSRIHRAMELWGERQ